MNKIQTVSLQANILPVPTWRHLKMNGCALDISYEQASFSPSKEMLALEKEGVLQRIPSISRQGEEGQTSIGEPAIKIREYRENTQGQYLSSFVQEHNNTSLRVCIKEGQRRKEPLVMNYLFDEDNPTLIESLVVDMEAQSSATLIRTLRTSPEGGSFFHAGSTRIHVGSHAKLTMLQLRYFDEGSVDLDELSVTLDEKATFTLVEIVMGSAQSYIDTHVTLQGFESKCLIGCMNVVASQGLADFNFHVEHMGVATNSSLLIRGALLDSATKLFRGTIDFHTGCKGSKGSEDEYCVLLSPDVKNRSVPLILCGEEDVEGSHAVSSGRLDHNALFYLTSRGIDKKKAERLLVEAQLFPILSMVSDEHIRFAIQEELSRRLDSHAQ
ncbi:MAG TPA: SufD family Fe-S cluster assembly protein [Sphaerochaeta sp.]|nr:SufD family Fe-S cluster assembly protein [Sphaerochaeta sp.]